SMGLSAENVPSKFEVSREAQADYAVRSHHRAYNAQLGGRLKDAIIPIQLNAVEYTNAGQNEQTSIFERAHVIRHDTTTEARPKSRTVFKADGTVSARTS
ncbi:acetyl-CoA C-acyltransferase, partial [Staphylococcus aureus]